MTSNADVPGDANPSGDVPGEHTAPSQTPHDGAADEPALSNETSHVVYDPTAGQRQRRPPAKGPTTHGAPQDGASVGKKD